MSSSGNNGNNNSRSGNPNISAPTNFRNMGGAPGNMNPSSGARHQEANPGNNFDLNQHIAGAIEKMRAETERVKRLDKLDEERERTRLAAEKKARRERRKSSVKKIFGFGKGKEDTPPVPKRG